MTSLASSVRLFLSLSLAVGLSTGLACDAEDTPCDNMCDEGIFGSVDEEAEEDTLTCACGKNTPSQNACEAYCVEMGGDAEMANADGNSCVCTGIE